eukprot:1323422-Prymnesium_polylepis.1
MEEWMLDSSLGRKPVTRCALQQSVNQITRRWLCDPGQRISNFILVDSPAMNERHATAGCAIIVASEWDERGA